MKFQLILGVEGDLVPDARSSVTAGEVPADGRVAVPDISAPHRLPHQVAVVGVDPQLPHAADESPPSLPGPVRALPARRDSPEKHRSKRSL